MRNHLMIDIETLGTGTFPVLLSLGAVAFDPWRKFGFMDVPPFYEVVDADSCLNFGAKVDFTCIKWWATDETIPPEARAAAFKGGAADRSFVGMVISRWMAYCQLHKIEYIWSHGISFDACAMMRYVEKLRINDGRWPVSFRNNRDTRTLWHLCPPELMSVYDDKGRLEMLSGGKAHQPVYDCMVQALRVQKAYAHLRVRESM